MKTYKEWIVSRADSGELIVMKRSSITSFHPKLNLSAGRTYVVFCSDGKVEEPMFRCAEFKDAEKWIFEQIDILEGVDAKVSKEN